MATKTPAPVARQEATPLESVVALMDNRDAQFLALLGSPEAVARFKTVALHAVTSRPDLLRCEKMSIIEAIREAASLDLEPTGVLGEAWLIPYKGMAKLRIGWQGHLKLIRRSGEVASVDCQVVYQNDRFELQLGTDPRIVHEPALKDRGDYRGAYAWARLKSGDLIIEWLPVEDVAPIRKIAAADSLMWDTFPGEGMRKSAIRRLQKRLPKSQHIEQALKVEAEAEEAPAALPTPARQAARAALEARFGNDDAGEPEPETANQEPEAVADAPATSTAPTGEICEALPGDSPLGLTAYCNKPAGHDGMHASDEGSWPR